MRIYHLTDPDGHHHLCVTDDRNHVVYPEAKRDMVLVEYGHDGEITDRFDFHETTDELKPGEKTTMRALFHKDSVNVWPDPEGLSKVHFVEHISRADFDRSFADYHEALSGYRDKQSAFRIARMKSIKEYTMLCLKLEEQQVAKMGDPPELSGFIEPHG
ncbi:MAG: hypothetical protein ACI9TH_003453 [Kiritimatiellia bacterium]|jgi:hypothetical protein